MPVDEATEWLYESAAFAVLSHNTDPDPLFIYGNKAAQRRFGYSWDEITRLPSRLSAEAPNREEPIFSMQQGTPASTSKYGHHFHDE